MAQISYIYDHLEKVRVIEAATPKDAVECAQDYLDGINEHDDIHQYNISEYDNPEMIEESENEVYEFSVIKTLQVRKIFILDVLRNGLTQDEINSFKWGNTPSEESRMKGCIQNLKPHASYEVSPEYEHPTNYNNVATLIQKWLAECNDISEVEAMTAKLCGQEL